MVVNKRSKCGKILLRAYTVGIRVGGVIENLILLQSAISSMELRDPMGYYFGSMPLFLSYTIVLFMPAKLRFPFRLFY